MTEKNHKLLRLIININMKYLPGICLAILVIILVAGLWPFNFFPKNKVVWLQDKKGVEFSGQGMILNTDFLNDPQRVFSNKKSITIEIVVYPTDEPQNFSNRILSIYDDLGSEITYVGQWGKHLTFKNVLEDPAGNILHKVVSVPDVLEKGRNYYLSIMSDAEGTTIYVNGQFKQNFPRHRMLDDTTSKKIGLILGSSSSGKNSWKGRIMGLAIYNRIFTSEQVHQHHQSYLKNDISLREGQEDCLGLYFFNEKHGVTVRDYSTLEHDLTIPELFRPVSNIILQPPWLDFRWNRSFLKDAIVNLLGFVPLGFFFTAFLLRAGRWERRTAYIGAALIGLAISLTIELSQIYLPSRDSQLIDVIHNFIGTISGILILHLVTQNRQIRL